MKKEITRFPCGWVRSGKRRDRLAHYCTCSDPACQTEWEKLVEQFVASQAQAAKQKALKARAAIDGCAHESSTTAAGTGAYCRFCGETIA